MYAAIEACNSLLLLDFTEPRNNAIRVAVGGTSPGDVGDIRDENTGDVLVRDVRPIVTPPKIEFSPSNGKLTFRVSF